MRNKITILLLLFISTIFLGCDHQACLQKRTDDLIKRWHKKADTVYLYSVDFAEFNMLWYHKDNFIRCYKIRPHRFERYKPIEMKTFIHDNDSIGNYPEVLIFEDIQCFDISSDGPWLKIYIKDKAPLFTGIDMECLFNTKYEPNSFPYKLQYDLFKLGLSPEDFEFEKMYDE